MGEHNHICRFDLSDGDARRITGHMASIKMLGGGDITDGFNEMQENHKYWKEQRDFNKNVASKAKLVAVGLITGGLLYALWEGIKHFIMEN